MAIRQEPLPKEEHCEAFRWLILDEDQLAGYVASLALGQHRHVWSVLRALRPNDPVPASNPAITSAVATLQDTDGENRYNRDGWLFQLVSWIALAAHATDAFVLDPPHSAPAQKGCDGLCLKLSDAGDAVSYVLVGEDKASDSPRSVFQTEVLPGIRMVEAGERDAELLARVTTLIERRTSQESEIDRMLESAHWRRDLRYRVCVGTTESKMPKRVSLFKGFKDEAPGSTSRRRGEVLILDDLRDWLDDFAQRVIGHLEAMLEDPDV